MTDTLVSKEEFQLRIPSQSSNSSNAGQREGDAGSGDLSPKGSGIKCTEIDLFSLRWVIHEYNQHAVINCNNLVIHITGTHNKQ